MRLVGLERDNVAWVAVEHDPAPLLLVPVSEFYSDPMHWLAAADLATEQALPEDGWITAVPVPATAKILCAGLNYRAHAAEASMQTPAHPDVFGRWASTLVPSGGPVPVPVGEPGLDWEGELAAVIGRPLYNATPQEVEDAVIGYAAFNDVSARRHQMNAGQWTVGKNADRSGPFGPALVTRDEIPDPYGLRIRTRVDGVVMQDARTSDMIFTIGRIGAYLTECMTLLPGDVIVTGTPEGIGAARTPPVYMQAGQVVDVEIERIGVLTTPIVAASASSRMEGTPTT